MLAQGECPSESRAAGSGLGKALMWACLGAGVSCEGAARPVGPASAAPEVGLSHGSAPPSFPAISQERGSPPQPQPGELSALRLAAFTQH